MLLEVKLSCECRRNIHLQYIMPWIYCSIHERNYKPVAIECREWKWKCLGCKTARFTGQSWEEARAAALRHHNKTGHSSQQIDYTRVPFKVARIKSLFGRTVKTFIIDQPTSWPGVAKRYVNNGISDNNSAGALTQADLDQIETADKGRIPF